MTEKASFHSLPLSQIAISSIDIERSEIWWREGLGFLPSASTRLFRGKATSGVVRLDNTATTTRWLVGQDRWLQIELWQYENPLPRLTLSEGEPNRVGFSRCGVWIKQFSQTLQRLNQLGTTPLGPTLGAPGERRVAVRDPDGILVELFEKDPLQQRALPESFHCNAALRSITLTTDDWNASTRFVEQGLGLKPYPRALHEDRHESLWQLSDARCERAVYQSDAILLEVVHYQKPATLPRHPHARLNDQGILNIAFGDPKSSAGIRQMELQALKAGATTSDKMNSPFGGCVYTTDPRGFSFEFMWARPGLGHRLTGYLPNQRNRYPLPTNQTIQQSISIDASPQQCFDQLLHSNDLSQWPRNRHIEVLREGLSETNRTGVLRRVQTRLFSVTEQITQWQPGKICRYRIVEGGPLANCQGSIEFTGDKSGTQVQWTLRFRSKIPGLGHLIAFMLGRHIKQQLHKSLSPQPKTAPTRHPRT